jgi:lipopolysaccharide transport system permease protein
VDVISQPDLPVIRIRPSRGWVSLRIQELWDYRELLWFLAWRDVKVRYKQAFLGVAWAIFQPLLTVVIFSIIFGQLAHLPSDGIPYPVFSIVALLPWQLFSSGLQRISTSLVNSATLLTKVYFPRLIIPLAAATVGLIDFVIGLAIALGVMAYYGIHLTWAALWVLPLVGLTLLAALAAGLWLAALNVQYRDVQQLLPFLIQVWMYASPVAYSAALITSARGKLIYGLNPLAGIVEGFRWAMLGTRPPNQLMLASLVVLAVLLVSGLYYFRRMERTFADVV